MRVSVREKKIIQYQGCKLNCHIHAHFYLCTPEKGGLVFSIHRNNLAKGVALLF